jgi:LysM repeat protein
MERKNLILGVMALMGLFALGSCYVQSTIPEEEEPSETPARVREQIERLHSFDPVERRNAAKELGKMGESAAAAVPFLIDLLNDNARLAVKSTEGETSSSSVAEAAMLALVSIGGAAVEPLITSLSSKHPGVRTMAAEGLGGIEDPRTIEPLIRVLESDGDTLVRAAAVDALRQKKDPRVLEALQLAEDNENWVVRSLAKSAAEEARREAGEEEAVPVEDGDKTTTDHGPWPEALVEETTREEGVPLDEGPAPEEESAPAEPAPAEPAQEETHTVQRGDTLYNVGKRYGIPWQTLMAYNGLNSTTDLRVGLILKIPPATEQLRPQGETSGKETVEGDETTYIVQQGDTLYSLGSRYGIPWQSLMKYNDMYDTDSLYTGQELKIPVREAARAPLEWDGVTTYKVQHGDILSDIGLLFGVSWREIAQLNGLTDPDHLTVGQVLKIPSKAQTPTP